MDSTDNGQRMGKAEAIGVLAKLAQKKTTTLEEVIAIQVAVRSTAKRLFDRERNWKRRHEAQAAYFTPPEALDFVTANPPMDIPPKAWPVEEEQQADNSK